MKSLRVLRYQPVSLIVALSVFLLETAAAQEIGASSGGSSGSCDAGLLTRFASGFFNAFQAVGLGDAASDVCFLNQFVLAFISFVMVGTVVYGVIMVSRENDLKTAFWPMFTVFFVFVLIGIISKVMYQTPV